ncbi:MAG: septal ring lytic transglycosylase RlpA family protein, partial [Comamonas sp.]
MPTDPAANAAASAGTPTASSTTAAAPAAGGERPRSSSRWSWLGNDRSGSEALAKVAPKPPRLSDKPDPAAQLDADAEPARDSDQKGMASWYGPGFHGRRTASGERFDSGELTAAHRS